MSGKRVTLIPVREHWMGVAWTDAPLPIKNHRCWVQTWGTKGEDHRVEYCPCGGFRDTSIDDKWHFRNSRIATPTTKEKINA